MLSPDVVDGDLSVRRTCGFSQQTGHDETCTSNDFQCDMSSSPICNSALKYAPAASRPCIVAIADQPRQRQAILSRLCDGFKLLCAGNNTLS
jgi:hypothetical protein